MDSSTLKIFLAMAGYMLIVIGIGLFYAKRSNKSSEDYFIGGRTLGPWVAAMSAEASDMSGWLLMGLPGVAYWCGIADAAWTAIGLAIGTYVNWLVVAKRLRKYSSVAGNAITIPEFFSNRYHEKKNIIMTLSAVFILIFFTVYASSCFVTCGKLFSTLFGYSYHSMLIVGAVFVVFYTFLGGFLAESVSDFMQAIVMVVALVTVLVTGTINAGGIDAVIANAQAIPGYLSLTSMATPQTIDGVQTVINGVPQFGEASEYGLLTILSTASWGLGYFGIPQVLLRFMAIRKTSELKKSRRIATVWVFISLFAAVCIGVIGRAIFPAEASLLSSAGAENIFINLSQALLPALLAGVVMAGILAATISSSDSYLLIASSAFAKNIYEKSPKATSLFKKLTKKDADDKSVMWVSRIALLIISIIGIAIAWDEESVIFDIVSFAWSGFGATFGPIMLFSLFWKRTTYPGAIAGMVSGAAMVFIWKLALKPAFGGIFSIYELMPAFLVSCAFIVVVSLLTKKPSKEIEDEFEMAKTGTIEE
ncbi:MAG: sodium/proline symporter [Clostridia bacterium]|nr:sodium/proline symporter [Clostridia bacterium]